jgi:putative transposase
MKRFKEKGAFFSARAPWWDYDADGIYFITTNVAWRKRLLGKVKDGVVELSEEGEIIRKLWEEIPVKFPSLSLDEFVIMPDHFHAIICKRAIYRATAQDADAPNAHAEKKQGGFAGTDNPMLHESFSTAIRWFKGRSTFETRKINPKFGWQPRFYDAIIRTEEDLERVRTYIRTNPERWGKNRHPPAR